MMTITLQLDPATAYAAFDEADFADKLALLAGEDDAHAGAAEMILKAVTRNLTIAGFASGEGRIAAEAFDPAGEAILEDVLGDDLDYSATTGMIYFNPLRIRGVAAGLGARYEHVLESAREAKDKLNGSDAEGLRLIDDIADDRLQRIEALAAIAVGCAVFARQLQSEADGDVRVPFA